MVKNAGNTQISTGIDVLAREKFARLQGCHVGLVTNHTGLTHEGQTTIDVLHQAPEVSLEALFGPEHGIRGDHDENVADSVDAKTKIPVYSLFGNRTQPTSEQLAGLDTLVFDIQDIGCRFYTYLSTLGNILEAASAHGQRVIVLDRPNPITGAHPEGPLAEGDALSFVAYHPIPVRHGLTLGELARLIHAEKRLTCSLEVVSCENWNRGDWYDTTGLLWINPSPNMRRLSAAALYPGIGLLEFTNVSVGRGTDTPFEIFGAPYLDPRVFAAALNAEELLGVHFTPVFFTPATSVFAGEVCGGVQIFILDREQLNAVQIGITIAVTLLRLYPNDWQPEKLMTLLCCKAAYERLLQGAAPAKIAEGWSKDLSLYADRVFPYLLYAAHGGAK